jgi:hypothetical protein
MWPPSCVPRRRQRGPSDSRVLAASAAHPHCEITCRAGLTCPRTLATGSAAGPRLRKQPGLVRVEVFQQHRARVSRMRDRCMRAARILLAVVHCSSHLARIIQSATRFDVSRRDGISNSLREMHVATGSGQTVATLNDLIGWLGWRKRQPRKEPGKANNLPLVRKVSLSAV